MTIREEFDYTFVDPHGVMFCLEARMGRGNENLWLRLLSPSSDKVIVIKPTREQWLELRATVNHVLDAEDGWVKCPSCHATRQVSGHAWDVALAYFRSRDGEGIPITPETWTTIKLRDLADLLRANMPAHVTAISNNNAQEVEVLKLPSTAAEQKETFERWLDQHSLDDTDFNDPPIPEEVT